MADWPKYTWNKYNLLGCAEDGLPVHKAVCFPPCYIPYYQFQLWQYFALYIEFYRPCLSFQTFSQKGTQHSSKRPRYSFRSIIHDLYSIIFVHGLHSWQPNHWDSYGNVKWCRERLPAQHPEARIVAYGLEEPSLELHLPERIDEVARDLLSQMDLLNSNDHSCSAGELSWTESKSVVANVIPRLFICQGFAGLVVKKAGILPHSVQKSI